MHATNKIRELNIKTGLSVCGEMIKEGGSFLE